MYRIFVVEDDRTIAREVCRLAESWGMEAKSAEDLRNVAAEAAAYEPHLIIMDIGLPFLTGITGAGSCGSRRLRPSCSCHRRRTT